MVLTLNIDMRETELIEIIKNLIDSNSSFKNIILNVKQLTLGDIIFNNEKGEDVLIIERKTINDLAGSINDGRYKEQSIRLSSVSLHNHNIIYLIEGKITSLNTKYNRISQDAIYSSFCSIQYHKGFSIMRSFDINESAIIILRYFNKIQKETLRKPFYFNNYNDTDTATNNSLYNDNCGSNGSDYISSIKKIKRDNITPDNIGSIFLSQIPGISTVTAIAIMDKYKTLLNLINELKLDINCLKDITYKTAKGQTRKINKNSIISIQKFIMNVE